MVKPHPIDESGPMRKYAQAINRAVDFAASMQLLRGKSYRVRKTTSGQLIDFEKAEKAAEAEPTDLSVQLMRVVAVYDDHLLCYDEQQNANGTITLGTTNRYVLKPFELRKTPFHQKNWGNIYYNYLTSTTRTAKAAVPNQDTPTGTAIEYQLITPAYQVRRAGTAQNDYGSQILAIRNPGGLDSTYSQCIPPTGQPNAGVAQPVEWMEICSIRVWAEYSFVP